jgi:hypothetical protein
MRRVEASGSASATILLVGSESPWDVESIAAPGPMDVDGWAAGATPLVAGEGAPGAVLPSPAGPAAPIAPLSAAESPALLPPRRPALPASADRPKCQLCGREPRNRHACGSCAKLVCTKYCWLAERGLCVVCGGGNPQGSLAIAPGSLVGISDSPSAARAEADHGVVAASSCEGAERQPETPCRRFAISNGRAEWIDPAPESVAHGPPPSPSTPSTTARLRPSTSPEARPPWWTAANDFYP